MEPRFTFGKKDETKGFKFNTKPHQHTHVDPTEGRKADAGPKGAFGDAKKLKASLQNNFKSQLGDGDAKNDAPDAPRFSFASSSQRGKVARSNPFAVEKMATDMSETEYDAAFAAMPVPYTAVSVAIDFSMSFPARVESHLYSFDRGQKRSADASVLLDLSRSPGAWRDAVVGAGLVWRQPHGPLGSWTWNLNATQPGVLLQSVQHYPERPVSLTCFVSRSAGENFVWAGSGLQTVSLVGRLAFSAEDLASLQTLQLTSLTIEEIVPEAIRELSKFSGLEELVVKKLKYDDLSFLLPLAGSLRKLDFPIRRLSPDAFACLTQLGKLRALVVRRSAGRHFTPDIVEPSLLPALPQVEVLRVEELGRGVNDADWIRQFRGLRELHTNSTYPPGPLDSIASLPHLRALSLGHSSSLNCAVLEPLGQTLTQLSFGTLGKISDLPKLPRLRKVTIPDLNAFKAVWHELPKWPALEIIETGTHRLHEAHVAGTLKWPLSLKEIVIVWTLTQPFSSDTWVDCRDNLSPCIPDGVKITFEWADIVQWPSLT